MNRTLRRCLVPLLSLTTAVGMALVVTAAPGRSVSVDESYLIPPTRTLAITGHGYGHGHGMSQYGAQGAALKGLTWKQIVAFYYPGTRLARGTGEIRVLVTADTSTDVAVAPRSGLSVRDRGTGRTYRLPTISGLTSWRLNVSGTKTVIGYKTSRWHSYEPGGLRALVGDGEFFASGPITLQLPSGSRQYRGMLRSASPSKGSSARDTVNVLSLDEYVKGVVPSEMPASWKPEAVRAQAVAARTYATWSRDSNASRYYQICDTTACQVYRGMSAEDSRSNAAVDATAGQILTYKGKPAFSQFSSSNGGWTSAGSVPYLPAKADPYDAVAGNKGHSWKTTVPVSTLEKRYSLGTLQRIRITSRDGHGDWRGRVNTMVLDGSRKDVTISGDTFRGIYGLRSRWFTFGSTAPTLPQAPGPVAAAALPERLSVTGSGWPDLVVRARSGGAMYVLPTAGLTGFGSRVVTGSGWNGLDQVAAVGDVTGDGKGDVLGRLARDGITRVYPGDGAGHVLSGRTPTTLFRYVDKLVGVGDFDKDGNNDVVARQGSGPRALYLFRGNDSGRFALPVLIAPDLHRFTDLVSPGDFDGDGLPDLIAKGSDTALWLFKGHKAGQLGGPVKLSVGGAQFDEFAGAGDYTRDGRTDLVARNAATGRTYLIPGDGHGGFTHYLGPFEDAKGLSMLSGGDLTGTSDPDLVGRDSAGRLVVVPHNGRDTFTSRITSGTSLRDATALLSVGDWNGDGDADLVTRENGGDSLWLRPGTGRGTWGARVSMGGSGWKGLSQLAAVGDVTGDGHPDLAGRTASGFMRIYAGNGRSGFVRAYSAGNSLRSYNQVGGTGIWNALNLPGATLVAGDGTFVPFAGGTAAEITFARAAGPGSRYDWRLGVGDVDGDRVSDLLVRDRARHYLWLLPGSGAGFGPPRFLKAGFGGYDLIG